MPITLVTGGASSGKSRFALSLINKNSHAIFVATGISTDTEMKERIKKHKRERPSDWETIEEPVELVKLFNNLIHETGQPIIIDCLTFWISNLIFYKDFTKEMIISEANTLSDILSKCKNQVVIVTNELGMGLIPINEKSRNFRAVAGEVNQIFAKKSISVYFVVSGIPINIKTNSELQF